MDFLTASAILRGGWLLNDSWAQQHLPIVARLLRGEDVTGLLGTQAKADLDIPQPRQLAGASYKVGVYSDLSSMPQGSIAVVDMIGPVLKYGGMCSYGLVDKAALLDRLDNAQNIDAIILNADSPGGQASGTAMFADRVKNMSKPVIGFVNDGMAASAMMWIISACTEVYASNKLSSFGSIGAYTQLVDMIASLEAQGIKVHEVYAPQSVDKNKDVRDLFATGNEDGIKEDLRQLVDAFIGDIQANRQGKLNLKAGDPFTGKMFNAEDAKKIGLIDGIMPFAGVMDRAMQLAKIKNTQKPNNKNMATNEKKYAAIASAAGWGDQYETTEEGLHLDHTAAAAVNTALETSAGDATKVQELTAQNEKLTKDLQTATQEASSWKAKAEEYGAKPAEDSSLQTDKDKNPETTETTVHPYTAQAQTLFNRFAGKK